MSLKRTRTEYGYNQVSRSNTMDRPYSKSSSKLFKKKPLKKITKTDISRAISRRLENKIIVDYAANQTILPASSTVAPTSRYLLPLLSQGLGQGNRIANQIHIRKARTSLYINTKRTGDNMINNPLMIRVWLVSSKIVNSNTAPAWNEFFQTGNLSAPFQQTMLDMILPVNKNEFVVYFDKTYKVGLGAILASNIDTTNSLDNSSMNHRIDIDWEQHFKSAIDYNDTNTVPTNRNLFLLFQCVRADGAAMVSSTESGAEFHIANTVSYED